MSHLFLLVSRSLQDRCVSKVAARCHLGFMSVTQFIDLIQVKRRGMYDAAIQRQSGRELRESKFFRQKETLLTSQDVFVSLCTVFLHVISRCCQNVNIVTQLYAHGVPKQRHVLQRCTPRCTGVQFLKRRFCVGHFATA